MNIDLTFIKTPFVWAYHAIRGTLLGGALVYMAMQQGWIKPICTTMYCDDGQYKK